MTKKAGIAMLNSDKAELKKLIDEADVISFDVFDTLLFRIVNTPETIFDLLGGMYSIPGFRKLRMNAQNEASRRAYVKYGWPHADMNQIYEVLSEYTDKSICWDQIREAEIEMEKDSLHANPEMKPIFSYARNTGKRIIAVTDMYLFADTISEVLEREGFHPDFVYCSADEHKAKFNKELFTEVAKRENVSINSILHIGDNMRDDVEYPRSLGEKAFLYHPQGDTSRIQNLPDADIDKGLFKLLYDQTKSFWYNLGVEVGGPLYMGLFSWLSVQIKEDKPIYFLSRDGYNLCQIFQMMGFKNAHYMYSSRRSLVMAGITEMNEADICELPPYVTGQTVGEVLDYLRVPREQVQYLKEAGFSDYNDVIVEDRQIGDFKKLYRLNKEIFLEHCDQERKNVKNYLDSIGFTGKGSAVFDCGWNGSSQFLLDKLLRAIGYQGETCFYYFGILNTDKSRRQLHGKWYEAYAFNFYRNYHLQPLVRDNPLLYELFFSAPHGSVLYFDSDGQPVFEDNGQELFKSELLEGIEDYIRTGIGFARKYHIHWYPTAAVSHLNRLIQNPDEEEAITIGDIENPDGFTRKQGKKTRIGYLEADDLADFKYMNLYWIPAVLKRSDIDIKVKKIIAKKASIVYPPKSMPEYHLEHESGLQNYQRWMEHHPETVPERKHLSYQPLFSVVIPVYNTATEQLRAAVDSVLAQTYSNYQLVLVDDHSSWENVHPVLSEYEHNDKVRVIYRQTNGNISVATNDGIRQSEGDFIVFMDCDDVIIPDALYEFALKLNENPELDFIYSDEDKITEDGKIRHMPFFKPDWSPDLFLSMMYTNHLGVYRASIVREIGGLRTAYNGSQDYDMTLRFLEKTDNHRVGHISRVLYHWRERKESVAFAMASKNYAAEAAILAKEDYFRRNHIRARMELVEEMSQAYPVYDTAPDPLVSIIIPSKDHPEIVMNCISSLEKFTEYRNYELIVVDNGSSDATRMVLEGWLPDHRAKYLYEKYDFNFSKMCNLGAEAASGEYLLFLNDDIETFDAGWLSRMLGQAMQKHTGAVGAKLFYPETVKIQHAGIVNGDQGPVHNFFRTEDSDCEYFGWNRIVVNCSAVTGACLMVSKAKFNEAGRFDEKLAVAYNDVDLCFRLMEKGYYNVLRNDAVLYHCESLSRGSDAADVDKHSRMMRELERLYARHPNLRFRDPFLNENLAFYSGLAVPRDNYDEMDRFTLTQNVDDDVRGDIVSVNRLPFEDRRLSSGKIRIYGWMSLTDETDTIFMERYLLLRDPYQWVYRIPVHPSSVEYNNETEDSPNTGHRGFECLVRKQQLRIDYVPYEYGLQIITPEGKNHISWLGKKSDVAFTDDSQSTWGEILQYDVSLLDHIEENMEDTKKATWCLDQIILTEASTLRISGWAFLRDALHYQYKTRVLLQTDDGRDYALRTVDLNRPDVTLCFPDIRFLYHTGFLCDVSYYLLPKGKYEIVLELKNQFEDKAVYIPTKRFVKLAWQED